MMRITVAVLAVTVFPACGRGAAAPDVAAYQQTVSELQLAVAAHQSDSAATTTVADCDAEHQRYDASIRPRLQRMSAMSGAMDGCGRTMGHPGALNLGSMCGSMQSELDRHAVAACAGDVAANHAEAARHCQLMRDWLGQQRAQASSMMNTGALMGGGRCAP